jgi:hypothetical protein
MVARLLAPLLHWRQESETTANNSFDLPFLEVRMEEPIWINAS